MPGKQHKSLIGKRFGKLTVVSLAEHDAGRHRFYYLCNCDCGGTKIVLDHNLRLGQTKSCGCLRGRPVKYRKGTVLSGKELLRREPYKSGYRYVLKCVHCGKVSWATAALRHLRPCACQNGEPRKAFATFTDGDVESVKQLLSQGCTVLNIAAKFKTSKHVIQRVIREHSLRPWPKNTLAELTVEGVKGLLRDGFRQSDIARKFKVCNSAVSRYLRRCGIKYAPCPKPNAPKRPKRKNRVKYQRIIGQKEIAEIQRLLDGGATVTDAARRVKINAGLIYREIRHFKTITYAGRKNAALPD